MLLALEISELMAYNFLSFYFLQGTLFHELSSTI